MIQQLYLNLFRSMLAHKKSINRPSHYELKTCMNGTNGTTQEPSLVHSQSVEPVNNLMPNRLSSSRSMGSYYLKQQRRQQAVRDQLNDTRVFIPNPNVFRCFYDPGERRKFDLEEEEEVFEEDQRKISNASSNISALRSSRTPRKSFWEKFSFFGIFSRKK